MPVSMRGLRIASIGGISIEVHPTWLLALGVVAYLLAAVFFPDRYEGGAVSHWILGVVASVLVFVTVLLHELAHAVVAIRRGLPVPRITLYLFGGVSHLSRQPRTAGEEFAIAAAGPAASFLLALAFFGVSFLVGGSQSPVRATFEYLALLNLVLGLVNILPGFPLDGGRVLRGIVWMRTQSFEKGTRAATGAGELLGGAMLAAAVVLLILTEWVTAAGVAIIGGILLIVARGEAKNLRTDTAISLLRARHLLDRSFPRVTPGASVQTIVNEHMITAGERAVVIANGDSVLGVLTVRNLAGLPRRLWPSTPAQQIMTPRADVVTVTADAPAAEVISLLVGRGVNPIPVIDEGRMIGLITRRALLDRIQVTEELDQVLEGRARRNVPNNGPNPPSPPSIDAPDDDSPPPPDDGAAR